MPPDSVCIVSCRQQGSKDVQAHISVHIEHDPPRCTLAQPLARLLGKAEANRHDILAMLFAHIQANGLMVSMCSPLACYTRLQMVHWDVSTKQSMEMLKGLAQNGVFCHWSERGELV